MSDFFFDFETASCCDLSERGLHNYATDKTTRILMMSFAFGDGEVDLWEPHKEEMPKRVRKALLDPAVRKINWNCTFERAICKFVLGIEIPFEQFLDVMVYARHLSLPGSLEDCGEVLGLKEDEAKLKDGKKLIHLFCEPFSMGGEETLFGITQPEFRDWNSHPTEWAQFCKYGIRDTESERTMLKMMSKIPLPETEQRGWVLDQKINDAGMPVNVHFVDNALFLAQKSKDELNVILKEKTGLDNPNSRNQILEWAKAQGYPHESMGKAFVNAALADPSLTPLCREVLKIRQEASKTSYKKFEAIKNIVSADGRLRNQFMFMGASRSGRWSGVGVQVQNLPRPDKETGKKYDLAVEMIQNRDYDGLNREFSSVIGAVTSCVRSSFQAPGGRQLSVCDLNAIENRVLGWVAGCDAILKVFREGRCPYLDFAGLLYKIPYVLLWELYKAGDEEAKNKRQAAKPAVLGAGFGLGPGVRKNEYGEYEAILKIDAYGNTVKTGLLGYAETMGIILTPKEAYEAWEIFRKSFPEVVQLWRNLEDAALEVLKRGGRVKTNFVEFSRIKRKDGTYILRITLPSGRGIHYVNARIEPQQKEGRGGQPYERDAIVYDGVGHGVGKTMNGWGKTYSYGGKICENIVQAIARDVLLHSMIRADEMGAEIFLHAHDEIGTLINEDDPFGFGPSDLQAAMCETPSWAPGLPLHAEGYVSKIYRKG